MIYVTKDIEIHENELSLSFLRASGPGGQHVNKVSTAVQLRFDVYGSPSLPEPVRKRLITLAGKRINAEGILLINAKNYRSQHLNRQDAIERFTDLVRQASFKPKPRLKTKPTLASKRRTLEKKRQRSDVKKQRKPVRQSDE